MKLRVTVLHAQPAQVFDLFFAPTRRLGEVTFVVRSGFFEDARSSPVVSGSFGGCGSRNSLGRTCSAVWVFRSHRREQEGKRRWCDRYERAISTVVEPSNWWRRGMRAVPDDVAFPSQQLHSARLRQSRWSMVRRSSQRRKHLMVPERRGV